MMYDLVLLTDGRYIHPTSTNTYIQNVLLEDELVTNALEKEGLKVGRKAWDDPYFDWSSTKFAMFRAVWDYFERIEEFTHWHSTTAEKTHFINSKELVDWNIDKHYLLDLKEKGVHIPPTLFIEAGENIDLIQAMDRAEQLGVASEEFVLKPCIAGGARHTYKFHKSQWEPYNSIFRELIAHEALMLQEFQRNIVSEGEISMMVMSGKYTHAILKRAKAGDFRVQDDWGGTVQEYEPSDEEINFAERAMGACAEMPLYGRVDIFKDNGGKIALAELEIFEPELWFRFSPEAAIILARAIKNTISHERYY